MVGQVLGAVGALPEIFTELEISYFLLRRLLGVRTEGDKKAAKFEDDYLEELIAFLPEKGIPAVTFMPSRNTAAQLDRLMDLCRKYGLKQISGEDINQPSQSFICRQLAEPKFRHLVDAAWELVEREREG